MRKLTDVDPTILAAVKAARAHQFDHLGGVPVAEAEANPGDAAVAGVKALNAQIADLKRRESEIVSERQKLENLLNDPAAREPGSGSSGSGAPADKVPPGTPETSGAAMLRTMGLRLT